MTTPESRDGSHAQAEFTAAQPDVLRREQVIINEWANAPIEIVEYPSGRYGEVGSRSSYEYDAGRRLLVGLHQVMDTSEAPWATATVHGAFNSPGIRRLRYDKKISVLERGAGLNIAGSRVVQSMVGRGSGEYHVIELNRTVAKMTHAWRDRELERLAQFQREQGIRLDIDIVVHEGDSRVIARDLAAQRKKFNIIISDTFPLTPSETGINDIEDLDVLKKILYSGDEGVFSFFAHYPGWSQDADIPGTIRARQQSMLSRHFSEVSFREAFVKPAVGYDYLFEGGRPVRSLPYVICTEKK